jgi:hypothetical protein
LYPINKANITADCLENRVRTHDLCDYNHKRQVEAEVHAPLATVDGEPLVKFRTCGVSKEIHSLRLGKACGFDGIPNVCLKHFLRRALVHLMHLFNPCFCLCHFPAPLKEAKITTLPKLSKDPKFTPNLRTISLLSTAGELLEKLNLKIIKRHFEEINLLNTIQFGFRAYHSKTLQCTNLTDYVTLNFNKNMSKVRDSCISRKPSTHNGTLAYYVYKLSELEVSASVIKQSLSFLTSRKYKVSVKGEFSTLR